MATVAGSRERASGESVVRFPSTSATQAPFDAAPVPASADDRDSYAVTALADVSDRSLHAVMARFTAGLSPAATGVRGVSQRHEEMVEFAARQILDVLSPSNFLLTNPEIFRQTLSKGGANLMSGARNLVEDWERAVSGKRPVGSEKFAVGRDVAVTPGKVILISATSLIDF